MNIARKNTSYLSVKEVAEFLGLKEPTLYNYIRMGKIPHYRKGKRILFTNSLLEFLI